LLQEKAFVHDTSYMLMWLHFHGAQTQKDFLLAARMLKTLVHVNESFQMEIEDNRKNSTRVSKWLEWLLS